MCFIPGHDIDNITDIVERFQLSLMLIAVAFRNLIELSGPEFDFAEAFVLPQSFGWSHGGNIVWRIFSVRVLAKLWRSVLIFLVQPSHS